jgi:hypothetical protein
MQTRWLLLLVLVSACGGRAYMASARLEAPAEAPAPVPLEQSVFARDPQGSLTEEALQQILAAPIELDLPARVGVLPIVTAKDWRGPSPDYDKLPSGLSAFTRSLRGSEAFTLVTEMMPIPSGSLGMEALREIAARYRLRYIILYREQIKHRSRLRGSALGYITVLGALFVPGQRLEVDGVIEASLFDVKTGLLMFTVRRSVTGRRGSNLWYQGDKLARLEAQVTDKFAPTLGEDVRADILRFADAVKVENDRRAVGVLVP